MAAEKGRSLRIKMGNGESPEQFTAIAGAREDAMTLNNAEIDITDKDSGGWRELMAGGIQNMSLTVSGITKSTALKVAAFAAAIKNFEIVNAAGDKVTGPFQIRSFEETGAHENDATTFSCTFESAGACTFTPAA